MKLCGISEDGGISSQRQDDIPWLPFRPSNIPIGHMVPGMVHGRFFNGLNVGYSLWSPVACIASTEQCWFPFYFSTQSSSPVASTMEKTPPNIDIDYLF